LRVGVWEQFYGVPVRAEIAQTVSRAAAMLDAQGFIVDAFAPEGLERAPNVWAFLFGQWGAAPAGFTGEQVLQNLSAREALRASLLRQMEGVAAILMPVCGITAFRPGERRWQAGDSEIGLFQMAMPAVIANVLGLPAVALPIAKSAEGLPIGVQLMGRPYEDELLLEIAVRLEDARGAWTGPA
jgi:Asp-tRNA(Asn)/Glu-tRNA(Gln) amidotransferase A subunit family amidase